MCGACGCGRTSPARHALAHFDARPLHAVAMQVLGDNVGSVWCYACDNDVADLGVTAESHVGAKVQDCQLLLERLLEKRAKREAGPGAVTASAVSAPVDSQAGAGAPAKSSSVAKIASKSAASSAPPVAAVERVSAGLAAAGGASAAGESHGIRGLSNLGNTCFFNSVMQSIGETFPLRRALLLDQAPAMPAHPDLTDGPFFSSLRDFFRTMWVPASANAKPTFSPSALLGQVIKANPMFGGGRQQDAHELFRCVLGAVVDEAQRLEREQCAQIVLEETSRWSCAEVETWFRSIQLEQPDLYLENIESSGAAWTGADLVAMIRDWNSAFAKAMRPRMGIKLLSEGKAFTRGIKNLKDGIRIGEARPKAPHTLVDSVFQGMLCSSVQCLTCHNVTTRRDPFFDLSLSITPPIQEPPPRPSKLVSKSNSSGKSAASSAQADAPPRAPPASLALVKMRLKEKKANSKAAMSKKADAPLSDVPRSEVLPPIAIDVAALAPPSSDSDASTASVASASLESSSAAGPECNVSVPADATGIDEKVLATLKSLNIEESARVSSLLEAESSVAAVSSAASDDKSVDADVTSSISPISPGSLQLRDASIALRQCATSGESMARLAGSSVTLLDALRAFTEWELLSGENMYACECCGQVESRRLSAVASDVAPSAASQASDSDENSPSEDDAGEQSAPERADAPNAPPPRSVKREAVRRFQLDGIPPVLVFALKRFMATRRGAEKVTKHVGFPLVLDMRDFVSAASAPLSTAAAPVEIAASEGASASANAAAAEAAESPATSTLYTLYAVIVQSGGMGSGHYIAYVCKRRGPDGDGSGQWHYFSDAMVKPSSWEEVQKAQAYMLFYQRR